MTGEDPLRYGAFETPLGAMTAGLGDGSIRQLYYGRLSGPRRPDFTPTERRLFKALSRQVAEYFTGRRRIFEVPWHPYPEPTRFQQAVWAAVTQIPYGETETYNGVGIATGRPRAARAVGNACGANPLALLVPCHRVVASDGIGGYGGRIDVKIYLLDLERRFSLRAR